MGEYHWDSWYGHRCSKNLVNSAVKCIDEKRQVCYGKQTGDPCSYSKITRGEKELNERQASKCAEDGVCLQPHYGACLFKSEGEPCDFEEIVAHGSYGPYSKKIMTGGSCAGAFKKGRSCAGAKEVSSTSLWEKPIFPKPKPSSEVQQHA